MLLQYFPLWFINTAVMATIKLVYRWWLRNSHFEPMFVINGSHFHIWPRLSSTEWYEYKKKNINNQTALKMVTHAKVQGYTKWPFAHFISSKHFIGRFTPSSKFDTWNWTDHSVDVASKRFEHNHNHYQVSTLIIKNNRFKRTSRWGKTKSEIQSMSKV